MVEEKISDFLLYDLSPPQIKLIKKDLKQYVIDHPTTDVSDFLAERQDFTHQFSHQFEFCF